MEKIDLSEIGDSHLPTGPNVFPENDFENDFFCYLLSVYAGVEYDEDYLPSVQYSIPAVLLSSLGGLAKLKKAFAKFSKFKKLFGKKKRKSKGFKPSQESSGSDLLTAETAGNKHYPIEMFRSHADFLQHEVNLRDRLIASLKSRIAELESGKESSEDEPDDDEEPVEAETDIELRKQPTDVIVI